MGDEVAADVVQHPGVDTVTAKAFVVEQDRPVIGMTTWIRDAAYTAVKHERQLQILAPSYSRLTYAMEMLLHDVGGLWVVRTDLDEFFDGLSGQGLAWTKDGFSARRRRRGPPSYEASPGSGDLELHISCLHEATTSLSLGSTTESAVLALTDHTPLGWGIAEPATEPWSRRSVTAAAFGRSPKPTHLVVAAAEVVGQLRITRVDSGVHEQLRLSGRPAGDVPTDAIEDLARSVAPLARSMFVSAHPSRLHGLRGSQPTMPPLPFGALMGAEVVAQTGGRDHLAQLTVPSTVIETPSGPAAWFRFDLGPGQPYEVLPVVLNHFGALPTNPGTQPA